MSHRAGMQGNPPLLVLDNLGAWGSHVPSSTSGLILSNQALNSHPKQLSPQGDDCYQHIHQAQLTFPGTYPPRPAPQRYVLQHPHWSSRKRALLIGINYSNQRNQLRDCAKDVRNMMIYLSQHFGYNREDMVMLTDDQHSPMSQPTKQNILRAMCWLVRDSRTNDTLVLHYSGHGNQFNGHECDENSANEVIYPIDFRQAGLVTDDEIRRTIIDPLPAGVCLTIIFDSYHAKIMVNSGVN